MKRLFVAVFLALGLFAVNPAQAERPELVGVLFYADWCGACKVLDPKIEAVKPSFDDAPVLFTRVDLTNRYTRHQSELLTSQLGLADLYAQYGNKTGFMVLVEPATGEVRGRLLSAMSEGDIARAIRDALSG